MGSRPSEATVLRIVSFVLALAAWAYIRFAGLIVAPRAADTAYTVPIAVEGLRPGQVASVAPPVATVVLPAGVAVEDVRATVDARGREAGRYRLPIAVEGAAALSLAPAGALVTLK